METRKYFLDWLRVIAFTLLVLFHVGMLYVTWPYNLKSPRLLPQLEWWMLTFSVWRMPLLFLISGVACRFLVAKIGPGPFALDRLRRLGPVVLFGMFVVIPPQTYVELVARGLTHQSYMNFWWFSYLRADQTLVAPLGKTMPTWDHLWFLVYLLVYSILFALAINLTRLWRGRFRDGYRVPIALLLIGPALWLAAANVLIELSAPLSHNLVSDWGGHIKWLGMFGVGAVCATQTPFWDWLKSNRDRLAVAASVLLAMQSASNGVIWSVVSGLYAWTAICAICGYASRYLNRQSALLSHLNQAILPIYVLHQPILLIAAYWIFPLQLPLLMEALLLVGMTTFGSLALYEAAIRPFVISRFLFGLKIKTRPRELAPAA